MTCVRQDHLVAIEMARAERSLYVFARLLWRAVEPATDFVPGIAMQAVCEHLEAVARGDIRRLVINIPPGFCKSLLTNVFFPAWMWGPQRQPHLRFLSTSYSAMLTERDNERCMRVVRSPLYQALWGDVVEIEKTGVTKIGTNHTGWKLATSVGGVATGERADYVLIDDPNDIRTAESAVVRNATNMWLREVMPTRLNSPAKSAIICIQQRTHEEDATGTLLSVGGDYCHLMIPMHYDPDRHCETSIGWSDWREVEGELAWPERYPPETVAEMSRALGPYAVAGQFEQAPVPRGGGIILREWWQEWLPRESPPVEFVLASLDTAVKEKEESDYYALTVWAVWRDPDTSTPRLLLLNAWRQRAALHVICQRVVRTCRQLRVDRLLIEDKAHGWVCQQEIVRLTGGSRFGISMFDPRRYGDKMARLLSIQHLFAEGLVYAPVVEDEGGDVSFRQWAQDVIDEVSLFPRAAHDDLCDSTSQAIRHLRDIGFALRKEEHARSEASLMKMPVDRRPLYPV